MTAKNQIASKIVAVAMCVTLAIAMVPFAHADDAFAAELQVAGMQTESAASGQTEGDKVLAKLQGWWSGAYHHNMMGFQPAYGFLHGKKIDWYLYDPIKKKVKYSNSVTITKVERFAENGKKGWRFFTFNNNWAYYYADGKPNELPIYQTRYGYGKIGSDYNIYSPERSSLKIYKKSNLNKKLKKTSVVGITVPNVKYTGKTVNPKVKFGHTVLKQGRDCKITYKNAKGKKISAKKVKARGSYTAVVKGKGRFKGKTTVQFYVK